MLRLDAALVEMLVGSDYWPAAMSAQGGGVALPTADKTDEAVISGRLASCDGEDAAPQTHCLRRLAATVPRRQSSNVAACYRQSLVAAIRSIARHHYTSCHFKHREIHWPAARFVCQADGSRMALRVSETLRYWLAACCGFSSFRVDWRDAGGLTATADIVPPRRTANTVSFYFGQLAYALSSRDSRDMSIGLSSRSSSLRHYCRYCFTMIKDD